MKEYYYSLISYQIQREILVATCSTNTTLASSFTRNERELLVKGKRESFKNVCKWITNTSNCTLETRSHKAAELLLFFLIILMHGTFVKHWLVCLSYAIGSAKSGPKTRWNTCPISSGLSVRVLNINKGRPWIYDFPTICFVTRLKFNLKGGIEEPATFAHSSLG